jgi:hypothetical protein
LRITWCSIDWKIGGADAQLSYSISGGSTYLCNIFINFFVTALIGLQLLPHYIFYLM